MNLESGLDKAGDGISRDLTELTLHSHDTGQGEAIAPRLSSNTQPASNDYGAAERHLAGIMPQTTPWPKGVGQSVAVGELHTEEINKLISAINMLREDDGPAALGNIIWLANKALKSRNNLRELQSYIDRPRTDRERNFWPGIYKMVKSGHNVISRDSLDARIDQLVESLSPFRRKVLYKTAPSSVTISHLSEADVVWEGPARAAFDFDERATRAFAKKIVSRLAEKLNEKVPFFAYGDLKATPDEASSSRAVATPR